MGDNAMTSLIAKSYHQIRDGMSAFAAMMRRFSWPIYCVVFLAGAALIVWAVVMTLADFRIFKSAGHSEAIEVPEGIQVQIRDLPDTTGPEAKPDPKALEPQMPSMDWREEEHLRRAAALLMEEGKLEAALTMLRQGDADRDAVRYVADAVIGRLRYNTQPIARKEFEGFARYWKSLNPEARKRHFPLSRAEQIEKLDLAVAGGGEIEAIEPHLPEGAKFTIMTNIHVQLAALSKAPDSVIELFVDVLFPTVTPAKKLYWKQKTEQLHPFNEHAAVFATAMNAEHVWPIARPFMAMEKEVLLGSAETTGAWYESVWGKEFTAELRRFFKKTTETEDARATWQLLQPTMQKLWGEHIYRKLVEEKKIEFSPVELEANPVLRQTLSKLDEQFLLRAVRTSPRWRYELGRFNYASAYAGALIALQKLWAGKYYVNTAGDKKVIDWPELLDPVRVEANELIKQSFNWPTFANRLKIREKVPNAIRLKRNWQLNPNSDGEEWIKTDPKEVHQALLDLAATSTVTPYEKIAKYYAINRNLGSANGRE